MAEPAYQAAEGLLDILLDGYDHAGVAEDLHLPSDRLADVRLYVLGIDDVDLAHDTAFAFNNIISTLREIIESGLGHNYAKWFTHSVIWFEVDMRHYREGIAPILRIVYRGAKDQRLGAHITQDIWLQLEKVNQNNAFPKVTLVNCYIGHPYEGPSHPIDNDYRNSEFRTVAECAQRAAGMAAADV